jgi:hypothetical protein
MGMAAGPVLPDRQQTVQYEKDLEVLATVGQLLATQSGQQQMLTAAR